MILTHGANSLARSGGNSVKIGDNIYHYVQIGNLYWTVEYLRETVGSVTFHNGIGYYNMYWTGARAVVANYVSSFNTGFRVPNSTDLANLVAHFTGDYNGSVQKSFRDPSFDNGTNESGLSLTATGACYDDSSTLENTGSCVLDDDYPYSRPLIYDSTNLWTSYPTRYEAKLRIPLRLCCNVT